MPSQSLAKILEVDVAPTQGLLSDTALAESTKMR